MEVKQVALDGQLTPPPVRSALPCQFKSWQTSFWQVYSIGSMIWVKKPWCSSPLRCKGISSRCPSEVVAWYSMGSAAGRHLIVGRMAANHSSPGLLPDSELRIHEAANSAHIPQFSGFVKLNWLTLNSGYCLWRIPWMNPRRLSFINERTLHE